MTEPTLYSFRRCPYAIRARMAMKASGLTCVLREVLLKDKPDALRSVSAKATVPVLVLADRVIDESLDVMYWALQKQDPLNWNAAFLQHPLIRRNDDYFKHYLDRYKYFDRYPECSQAEYREHALVYLKELEINMVLGDGERPFLVTPQLNSIDVAIFPFVRQFAFVDKPAFDDLSLPLVQAWLDNLLNSEAFLSVMQKYPPWSPLQTPVIYL